MAWIENNIFDSIEKISAMNLQSISFDETIVATIIQQDSKDPQKYIVSTDSLKFEAYAEDGKEYVLNSQVYILIPKGNYNDKKTITGKYELSKQPKIQYCNPFKDYLKFVEEKLIDKDSTIIKANEDEKYYEIQNNLITTLVEKIKYVGIESRYNINAMPNTNYSLNLNFYSGTNQIGDLYYSIKITDKELYGNPYKLTSNFKFQHLYQLPDELDINKINIIGVSLTKDDGDIAIDTLTVSFGFDTTQLDKSKIVLTNQTIKGSDPNDQNSYDPTKPDTITKDLSIEWFMTGVDYKFNNQYNNKNIGNYKIYWCKQTKNYQQKDTDFTGFGNDWQTLAVYSASNTDIENYYRYQLTCSSGQSYEIVKVGITDSNDTLLLESNSLRFTNTGPVDLTPLKLENSDDGVYNYYGLTGYIVNSSDAINHSVTAKFTNNIDWDETLQKIEWFIPYSGTMILPTNLEGWGYADSEFQSEDFPLVYQRDDNGEFITDDLGNFVKNPLDKFPSWYALVIQPQEENNKAYQTLPFELMRHYASEKVNNTIKCRIIRWSHKDNLTDINKATVYEAEYTYTFGYQGNSGSGLSLNIIPSKKVLDLSSDKLNDEIEFTVSLEKVNGEPFEYDLEKIKWSWYYDGLVYTKDQPSYRKVSKYFKLYKTNNAGEEEIVQFIPKAKEEDVIIDIRSISSSKVRVEFTNEMNTNIPDFAILQATCPLASDPESGLNINLYAYYPIVIRNPNINNPKYIQGITTVAYDSNGNYSSTEEIPYMLFDENNEPLNCSWKLVASENTNATISNDYILRPQSTMSTKLEPYTVQAISPNGSIMWQQPILIVQNTWEGKMINAWDGSLDINEENNMILSQFIGAGEKNQDNQFSGVLMGVVGKERENALTGLYGYGDGQLRFSFNEKGQAYIGTGGDNYISFNGGNSQSNSGELSIKTKKFDLTTDRLTINSTEGIKLYDASNRITVNINNTGTTTIGGWNINYNELYSTQILKDGTTRTSGFQSPNYGTHALAIGAPDPNNWKDAPFKVTHDGKLTAKEAYVEGDIVAKSLTLKDPNQPITGNFQPTSIDIGNFIVDESGNVTINGNATIKGTTTITGNATFNGVINSSELSNLKGTLDEVVGKLGNGLTVGTGGLVFETSPIRGTGYLATMFSMPQSGYLIFEQGQEHGDIVYPNPKITLALDSDSQCYLILRSRRPEEYGGSGDIIEIITPTLRIGTSYTNMHFGYSGELTIGSTKYQVINGIITNTIVD